MPQPDKRWVVEQLATNPILSAGPIGRAWRFVSHDVWRADSDDAPLWRRLVNRIARIGFLTFKSFSGDRCVLRAMALTYTTVLSLVPLLAFSFAMLKGIGWYEELRQKQIEPYLDELFGPLDPTPQIDAPDPSLIEPMQGPLVVEPPPAMGVSQLREGFEYVLDLVDRTDLKGLGVAGLVVLMMAVLRLLSSIENSFNEIWGVRRARTWVRKLSDYLTIVVITPIFLVIAVGVTGAAQSAGVVEFVENRLALGALIEWAIRAAPVLVGWVAFTLVYLVMPNRRGKVRSAVIGGAVASVLWQLALLAHIKFQLGVARYNAIYAGFAVLPIFLAWVQISWLIVLLGAELAFAHESEHEYRGVATYENRAQAYKESLAVRAMTRISGAFLDGAPPVSGLSIAAGVGVSPREVDEVLAELERGRLALRVEGGEGVDGPAYSPSRDPSSISVVDVLEALRGADEDARPATESELDVRVEKLLGKLGEEARGSAYNRSMRELVEEARSRAVSSAREASEARAQPS